MRKLIVFLLLSSLFFISFNNNAQAQWEGAHVQRLTYDDLPNEVIGLYIDDTDKLYLFYLEGVRDTITGFVYDYRIFYKTKEKDGNWSQPEEIQTSTYIFGQNRNGGLWMDTRTGIIHIIYCGENALNYANSTVPGWEFIKIDSLAGEQAYAHYNSFDMGFDDSANVHVAWHLDFDSLGTSWYKVIYANNSTGEWVKQQVSPSIFLGGMQSGETFFDIQKNGIAHIIYYGYPGSGVPYYARNDCLNGNDWDIDTIPRPSRPLYYYGPGLIRVDVNDRVHLITGGCIEQDCVWPGLVRMFYYYKQAQDSIWQGPEVILDSLFRFSKIFIDSESVPYLTEWDPFTHCRFFTDRKQGFWREPYQILDTTSMCNALSSFYLQGPFPFVLDSEERGHAVFAGSMLKFISQDDSLEIFYYGPPLSSVDDTLEDHEEFTFELLQNYPNPFNQNTVIRYSLNVAHPIPTTLKLYNILGKEVKQLVNTKLGRGNYEVIWDGTDNSEKEVSSGIYFYRLKAGDYKQTRKLVLIK